MNIDKERRKQLMDRVMDCTNVTTIGIKIRRADRSFKISRLVQIVNGEEIATNAELIQIAHTLGIDSDVLIQSYTGQFYSLEGVASGEHLPLDTPHVGESGCDAHSGSYPARELDGNPTLVSQVYHSPDTLLDALEKTRDDELPTELL